MADIKTYHPEEIDEVPFPGQQEQSFSESNPDSGGNYSATQTSEKSFPRKRTATQLISTALNTRSKKILQKFELESSGGFQIGDFKTGISGDLRITPNGLTARDSAGITTFALDGTDGSAVFAGEMQSGSVITGSVITGEVEVGTGVGDSYVLIDGPNNRIVVNDGSTNRIVMGNV